VEEEIKSPLPPRRIEGEEAGATKTEEITTGKSLVSEPTASTRTTEIPGKGVADTEQKSKNKKNILIWGLIGLAIIAIAGLVFKVIIPLLRNPGSGETTLVYWGLWERDVIVDGVLKEFESKNPGIRVKYVFNSKTDYRSRLAGRLNKDPEQEEVPDIFRFHSSWLPMFRDYLQPVPQTVANSIGLENDFYDVYKADLKIGNSYFGVPMMYDGLALYYNKDLIEASQVNLPKTWWDLQSAAKALTVRDQTGKIQVAGVAMGLADNVDHWSDIVGLIMKQNGAELISGDPQNDAKLKNVLDFYVLFSTKDGVWHESLPPSTDMFVAGKLAFYFAPSWRVFNIEEMKSSQNPKLRYEITTVPQLPILEEGEEVTPETKLTNINWATYWAEGVNSKSNKQKAAWKLLEFLTSKETLTKLYSTAAQTRNFGEIYPRKSMAGLLTDNELVKPFVMSADSATSGYLSSRTFDSGLNDEMSKYFGDAINSLVFKNISDGEIMTSLKNGIGQLAQKYQLNKK